MLRQRRRYYTLRIKNEGRFGDGSLKTYDEPIYVKIKAKSVGIARGIVKRSENYTLYE